MPVAAVHEDEVLRPAAEASFAVVNWHSHPPPLPGPHAIWRGSEEPPQAPTMRMATQVVKKRTGRGRSFMAGPECYPGWPGGSSARVAWTAGRVESVAQGLEPAGVGVDCGGIAVRSPARRAACLPTAPEPLRLRESPHESLALEAQQAGCGALVTRAHMHCMLHGGGLCSVDLVPEALG